MSALVTPRKCGLSAAKPSNLLIGLPRQRRRVAIRSSSYRDLAVKRRTISPLLRWIRSFCRQSSRSTDQWWNDERSSNSEEMRTVRSQTQQFVDWLAEAEDIWNFNKRKCGIYSSSLSSDSSSDSSSLLSSSASG
jgi:hypothetical protein